MKSFDELKGNLEKGFETMKEAKNNSSIMVNIEKDKFLTLTYISSTLDSIDKNLYKIIDVLDEHNTCHDQTNDKLTAMIEFFDKLYREYRTK